MQSMSSAGARLMRIRSIRQVFHCHLRTLREYRTSEPGSSGTYPHHTSLVPRGTPPTACGRTTTPTCTQFVTVCTMATDKQLRSEDTVDYNQKKKKKQKVVPPSVQYRIRIQQAAKRDTIEDAFAAYEEAKAEGVRLPPDCLVTMLFLAAGGDRWEDLVICEQKRNEHLMTKRLDKCDDILSCLQATGSPSVEMCYTALARRDAICGNGWSALEKARIVVQEPGMAHKLRCFLPALVAFGALGDARGAFDVYNDIMKSGLEPGETEFCKMIQSISKHYDDIPEDGNCIPWSQVESILMHMSRETTELEPETVKQLSGLFKSKELSKHWTVSHCTVEENGYCEFCGETLEAIDLDQVEYAQFASGIASLASKQEKRPRDFDTFLKWLEEYGPYGIIIDAANVAFYGQNFESGGFNFSQIEAVVNRVEQDFPDLKPLVILHVNRTRGHPASSYKAKTLLKRLNDEHCFYAAPQGSNDDWYWMYAAVSAGQNGILISNDEMRDHLFNLLAPKYFKKWKQRHQMRYTFSGEPGTLQLENPPSYTRCTQQVGTSWMFPEAQDEKWLCVKRHS